MAAGAVAAAGFLTIATHATTIISALRAGLKDVRAEGDASDPAASTAIYYDAGLIVGLHMIIA